MSEKEEFEKLPDAMPKWIKDHVDLYLSDPEKAHLWDSTVGWRPGPLPPVLMIHPGAPSRNLRPLPPLREGHAPESPATQGQPLPGHQRGRRLFRQQRHARRGGVHTQQECFEVQSAPGGDHDLAIQHSLGGEVLSQRRQQLGEIPVQWLAIATL